MNTSIGQAIALVTAVNAAAQGKEVTLDLGTNPWFKYVRSCRFGPGKEESRQIADNLKGWVENMVMTKALSAYLWFEPFNGDMQTINLLGFAGSGRWAPTVRFSDAEVIWHQYPTISGEGEDRRWDIWYGGYAVQPGQHSVQATPQEAADRLYRVLAEIIDFTEIYRPHEDYFQQGFAMARQQLAASGLLSGTEASEVPEIQDHIKFLFPEGLYPESNLRLVDAVSKCWMLGGMGSWNDWGASDHEVNVRFTEVTKEYYQAMGDCLYAGCAWPPLA